MLSPVPDGVTVVASFEKAERLRERKKPDPLLILEPLQELLLWQEQQLLLLPQIEPEQQLLLMPIFPAFLFHLI